MTKLSETTVKSFGNEKDEMSLPRVSCYFRDATKMLGKLPDINVHQVTGFMNNLDIDVAGRESHRAFCRRESRREGPRGRRKTLQELIN